MRSWKRFVLDLLIKFDNIRAKIWLRWKKITGLGTQIPIAIDAYLGYGRINHIFLLGRVLKYRYISNSPTDSGWRTMMNNFKRLNTKEIRGARLEITIQHNKFEVETDAEGFFKLDVPLNTPLPLNNSCWIQANVLLTQIPWKEAKVKTQADVQIPIKNATFGIISDIDDTILKTDLSSLMKMKAFYITMFKNVARRQTFSDLAAFYQALQKGYEGDTINPFFYVSKSPWNLYDFLIDFIALNDLPKGPLLLRDYGLPAEVPPKDYKGHKHTHIEKILNTYPELPFILIGDSGENDTKLYLQVAQDYPGRIASIYIRDVNHKRKAKKTNKLIEKAEETEILMVKTYREAAIHAALQGLLDLNYFERLTSNVSKVDHKEKH